MIVVLTILGQIGVSVLEARQMNPGASEFGPATAFQAGRSARLAGIGEPDVPDSVYIELGKKRNGNWRIGPGGEILGGGGRVFVQAIDPTTGQTKTASSSCIQAFPNVFYSSAHGTVPRTAGWRILRSEVTFDVWNTSNAAAMTDPITVTVEVDAFPLEGWVDGPDQAPERGRDRDFAILVSRAGQPSIPMGVAAQFATTRPEKWAVLELFGFGMNRGGQYLTNMLSGYAVKGDQGFLVGGYNSIDFISIQSQREYVPVSLPVIQPANGDSGGGVAAQGKIAGIILHGTLAPPPGHSTAVDLTSDLIRAHRERFVPNEPSNIACESREGALMVSWDGPSRVDVLHADDPNPTKWGVVSREEIAPRRVGSRWEAKLSADSNQGFFKIIWRP